MPADRKLADRKLADRDSERRNPVLGLTLAAGISALCWAGLAAVLF